MIDFSGPSDVNQGFLGNCWFLSAVAAIAERRELLENVFVTQDTSPHGVYQIRLCMGGEWKVFTIDDTLPCTSQGRLAFCDGARGKCTHAMTRRYTPSLLSAPLCFFGCAACLSFCHFAICHC